MMRQQVVGNVRKRISLHVVSDDGQLPGKESTRCLVKVMYSDVLDTNF